MLKKMIKMMSMMVVVMVITMGVIFADISVNNNHSVAEDLSFMVYGRVREIGVRMGEDLREEEMALRVYTYSKSGASYSQIYASAYENWL